MSAPNLGELQSWLRWAITDPRGVRDALADPSLANASIRFEPIDRDRVLARYRAPIPDCAALVGETRMLGREDRLSVYAEAYLARISRALAQDFRSVRRLVGENGFEILISDYLKEFPSRYENLAEVGRDFAGFLCRHEAGRALSYLTDLAHLEWKIIEAFHAPEIETRPNQLAEVGPEQWPQARLVLDPSLRWMSSSWSIDEFWSGTGDAVESAPTWLRIFREGGEVRVDSVECIHLQALEAAKAGRSVGEICGLFEDAECAKVEALFSEWVMVGIVRKIELETFPRQ